MSSRIKSGIDGLDRLIEGGFPQTSAILVCGAPGTGKSIFALQYIAQGLKTGENGVYATIEQNPEQLIAQAESFGWEFKKAIAAGKISFLRIPANVVNYDILKMLKKAVDSVKAKRLVVDSISAISINAASYQLPMQRAEDKDIAYSKSEFHPSGFDIKQEIMQFVYLFIKMIGEWGITTLFVADAPENDRYLTRDTVSEFACDGVVQLKLMSMGKTVSRSLEVKKMRNTSLKPGINTMTFESDGIKIKGFEY